MKKLIILIFIPLTLFANNNDIHKPETLLQKAEEEFKLGNEFLKSNSTKSDTHYKNAVSYYEELIKIKYKNPEIYYNLGNAYFRQNEIGNAVLMYRRALLFNPSNKQIKYNLNQARKKQKNGFNYETSHEIIKILFFWHYEMTILHKTTIFIILNFIFWALLTLKRLGKKVFYSPIIIGLFGLVIGFSAIVDMRALSKSHGVIVSGYSIGRMGDSKSYEESFAVPLYEGVEFTVVERRIGWVMIKLPDDSITWIEESDCKFIEEL